MISILCLVSLVPCAGLLLLALLPSAKADLKSGPVSRWVSHVAALNLAGAACLTLLTFIRGPVTIAIAGMETAPVSLLLDGVSTVMWTLVAFVGWVTCRYSVRYLDGENHRGRYFRWAGFTIGSVSLVVVSGNLLLTILAFLLTGLGLHQLLVHYSDRRAARSAATAKFVFSRLGDLCLFAAAVLLYRDFGTLDLVQLFRQVELLQSAGGGGSTGLVASGWLIAACAILKSAQFPFHTWLPETMEAPTPVSAMMHAGVVNAGGFLLIRTAPLFTGGSLAMPAVACLGAFTAVAAAVVMMTQTNVKQRLAYSTIAQMGFMMLQCGLGAFSAALLHIVAHSLYKAHAFLASGSLAPSVPATTASTRGTHTSGVRGFVRDAATLTVVVGLYLATGFMFGITPAAKPGGLLLGSLLCCGLTVWLLQLRQQRREFPLSGLLAAAVLLCTYQVSWLLADLAFWSSVSRANFSADIVTASLVAVAFFALLLSIEAAWSRCIDSRVFQSLYVHASHGFYADLFWRRIATALSS